MEPLSATDSTTPMQHVASPSPVQHVTSLRPTRTIRLPKQFDDYVLSRG